MTCRLRVLSQGDVLPHDAGQLWTCVLLPCLHGWVLNHSPAAVEPCLWREAAAGPCVEWVVLLTEKSFAQKVCFPGVFYWAVSAALFKPWHGFCTLLTCPQTWLKCHIWHSKGTWKLVQKWVQELKRQQRRKVGTNFRKHPWFCCCCFNLAGISVLQEVGFGLRIILFSLLAHLRSFGFPQYSKYFSAWSETRIAWQILSYS